MRQRNLSAALCIALFVAIRVGFGPATSAAETGRLPLLMPDDFSDMHLVAWRVEPGVPDSQPLIEGEMPWDRGGVGIHGSVLYDPLARHWKAYLVCTPAEETPLDEPDRPWSSQNAAHRRICLFESDDAKTWTRPALHNVAWPGFENTNIIFDTDEGVSAYSSILIDEMNHEWPYEMFVLREAWGFVRGRPSEGNGYYRYRSHDGRAWEPVGGKIDGPMTGDLCFFYKQDGGYVAYYRLGYESQPTDHLPAYEDFPRRSCFRATSADGWSWDRDPLMLLTADERDHRDTQYQECVPHAVPGGYVALVTMYWPLTQTLNFRWAASRDGRQWWFPDRRPCLDNAPLGDYGGGMLWQSQRLMDLDDRLYVYYGGTEGPHRQISDTRGPSNDVNYLERVLDHGAHFLPFNAALCRASWRSDRVYALAASAGGPTLGSATTRPLDASGKQLIVNLRTREPKRALQPHLDEGWLKVELLDESGTPIPGFTLQDCQPLTGDFTEAPVAWTGGDLAPSQTQQARFVLKRAFLYGFEFRASQ